MNIVFSLKVIFSLVYLLQGLFRLKPLYIVLCCSDGPLQGLEYNHDDVIKV